MERKRGINMSKGKSVAGFIIGIITTLCGIAAIVLNAAGMHESY